MDPPILSDPNQHPSEEIVFSHIGKTRPLWISFFEHIHSSHPDFAEEWRYYRDGKSWLLKVTRKNKTVFWLSVVQGSFKTTFYFTEKAEKAIMSADLSDELKEQFRTGKRFGKIAGITVVYRSRKNIEDAKTLIGIKIRLK